MRRNLLLASAMCCLTVGVAASALASPAAALHAQAVSPASQWLAALESAPGRDTLDMQPQQTVPDALGLPDGSTIVAGTVNTKRNIEGARLVVARLLPNGRPDPAFGELGVELTQVKLLPWQILPAPDGDLLILGPGRSPGAEEPRITRFPDWLVLRLLADGRPDPSFGHDGLLDVSGVPVSGEGADSAVSPQMQPNGDILLPTVIGQVLTPAAVAGIVRLAPDGARDASFGSDGTVTLASGMDAFALDADGSLSIATGGPTGVGLRRLTAAGTPDTSFNGGLTLQTPIYGATSMLVTAEGAVELFGYPSSNSLVDSSVWRYTPSGAPDTGWGSDGVVDLGPPQGYLTDLLTAPASQTLVVTMGVPSSAGLPTGAYRVQLRRLTAAGQLDLALGGVAGLLRALPFGGETYAPGAIAPLRGNSFAPSGVIERADGTLLFSGSVEDSEAYVTEGGPEPVAWFTGLGLAALNSSFQLDPQFNASRPAQLTARVLSRHLTSNGISLALRSSGAALAVVTVRGAGKLIARGTVPFFSINQALARRTLRIPLTRAGKRMLGRRLRIKVSVSAANLVAGHASAHTSATLAG
ncbi:MAG: hypothetical protein ACLP1Q_08465 [Solirubrobacteraceae bacterium]